MTGAYGLPEQLLIALAQLAGCKIRKSCQVLRDGLRHVKAPFSGSHVPLTRGTSGHTEPRLPRHIKAILVHIAGFLGSRRDGQFRQAAVPKQALGENRRDFAPALVRCEGFRCA